MARVKITEYRAKKLLLGDAYHGILLSSSSKGTVPGRGVWVAKVDQGIKKRAKQGLVSIGKKAMLIKTIAAWKKKGFNQFLIEPFVEHPDKSERYISFERVRQGIRVLYSKEGGVEIESYPEDVQTFLIQTSKDIGSIAQATNIPESFLHSTIKVFDANFFGFLEINPFVIHDDKVILLDAAGLVDSAGAAFTKGWGELDLVKKKAKHAAEINVEALSATTPASLAVSVLNPDGKLFFLLSGGGGSIVIADSVAFAGAVKIMGNYGEYSGGPTQEETYLYAKEIIDLMLASRAKKKALIIAGGVANFTDIKETFAGLIDALRAVAPRLRKQGIKIFVRRGGPNEHAGLELMRNFLVREDLLGTLYGSDTIITQAIQDAIHFVT